VHYCYEGYRLFLDKLQYNIVLWKAGIRLDSDIAETFSTGKRRTDKP
jgi:hypothetical protein